MRYALCAMIGLLWIASGVHADGGREDVPAPGTEKTVLAPSADSRIVAVNLRVFADAPVHSLILGNNTYTVEIGPHHPPSLFKQLFSPEHLRRLVDR